ncbi:MAG: hypothetical protein IPP48_10265 [Chitinophagaceae bacterium]|nr:hypothetical protein [Chitinophagaceae bacterium]
MKLLITIVLLFTANFLMAQTDTGVKKIAVKVLQNGKIAVKPIATSDSMQTPKQLDSLKKAGIHTITVAKDYPFYHSNMSFWGKCKYWASWFKYEHPYLFWGLLVLLGLWILKMLYKLLER